MRVAVPHKNRKKLLNPKQSAVHCGPAARQKGVYCPRFFGFFAKAGDNETVNAGRYEIDAALNRMVCDKVLPSRALHDRDLTSKSFPI